MSRGHISSVAGTCGLGVLFGFQNHIGPITHIYSGTGFCVAGFVNNPNCASAYRELKTKYKIVYQSPVRKNRNSGRQFFFIIFDTRKTS